MPAFNHDDRIVDPDEVRAPNFASVLLVDLGVAGAPLEVQRRAVADWLEDHEPSDALLGSLERSHLVQAKVVVGRDVGLTAREVEVLALVARGASTQEIGAALFISPSTARTHMKSVLRKLNVSTRAEAAVWAARHAASEGRRVQERRTTT